MRAFTAKPGSDQTWQTVATYYGNTALLTAGQRGKVALANRQRFFYTTLHESLQYRLLWEVSILRWVGSLRHLMEDRNLAFAALELPGMKEGE